VVNKANFIGGDIMLNQNDPEVKIRQAYEILKMISEDTSVPRNIRRTANEAIEILMNKGQPYALRSSNAISLLDEAAIDPNCPMHARTKIWQVITILEPLNR